jgi:hypothetical protein
MPNWKIRQIPNFQFGTKPPIPSNLIPETVKEKDFGGRNMCEEVNYIREAKQNIPMDNVFCNEAVQAFYYNADEDIRRMFWKDVLEVESPFFGKESPFNSQENNLEVRT